MAAAKVGGIGANSSNPVGFVSDNLQIQTNIFDAAASFEVPRLLFLGSSCIYPRDCPQPIREDYLLTGPLEETNDAYAIAKIAGLIHVRSVRKQFGLPWISAMPTNLYGPGDNFSVSSSHVLPALIRRFHDAALSGSNGVTNWGSGSPRREFLHVDDLADAVIHLLECYDSDFHVNVGTGTDISIADLSSLIASVVGFTGDVEWDDSKPDGTPRKVLDVSLIESTGWSSRISLEDGLRSTFQWYLDNLGLVRR